MQGGAYMVLRALAVSAHQWLQGGADAGPLLSASQGVASGLQLEAGAVAWAKADTYYFRTMARMQRLWEASFDSSLLCCQQPATRGCSIATCSGPW